VQPRHPRRWDSASLTDTKFKQLENPVTASLECGQQLSPRYCVSVDPLRYTDPVPSPQHLDPHAAGIVKVAGDHSHGSPGHARYHHGPQFSRKVLDQEHCDSVVRLPRCDNRARKINFWSHRRVFLEIPLTPLTLRASSIP